VLGTLYSTKNANKLSATMWDKLVDEVGWIGNDLDTLSWNTAIQITALSGRVTQLSGTMSNIVSSQWTTKGNDIYYTKGTVGIWTTSPSTSYKLHVVGNAHINGNLTANTPTSSSPDAQVATKKYVDDREANIRTYVDSKGGTSSPQYMYVGLNSTNAKWASETYTVNDVDFCIINSVMYSTKGSYGSDHIEYCYAYPMTEPDWALPNAVEVYSWKTLWRTNRKLYVGGDDDDQIDCWFICIRL
jgi:hypothetical protein